MDQFPKVPYDKNLQSATKDTLPNPYLHPEYRKVPYPKGPRELQLEAKLKKEIDEEYSYHKNEEKEETLKIDYTTSQQLASSQISVMLEQNQNNYSNSIKQHSYATDTAISFFTESVNGTPGKISFKKTAAFSSGKYDM